MSFKLVLGSTARSSRNSSLIRYRLLVTCGAIGDCRDSARNHPRTYLVGGSVGYALPSEGDAEPGNRTIPLNESNSEMATHGWGAFRRVPIPQYVLHTHTPTQCTAFRRLNHLRPPFSIRYCPRSTSTIDKIFPEPW